MSRAGAVARHGTIVGGTVGDSIATMEDVTRLIADEPQLSAWTIRARGAHFVEVEWQEAVLVLAWPQLWRDRAAISRHLTRARSGNHALVLCGSDEDFTAAHVDELTGDFANVTAVCVPSPPSRFVTQLRAWAAAHRVNRNTAQLELELQQVRYENELLIDVGRSLSEERDLGRLHEMILGRAREVTGADAGSIWLVEGDDSAPLEQRTLHNVTSQNDSVSVPSTGITVEISPKSIAGTCVIREQVINIPDLYSLDSPGTGNNPWGFVHDRSLDTQLGYQTRSMVTVPMISGRKEVIGVIQLINKRARENKRLDKDFEHTVVPFDDVSIRYARSLASQAGIALETTALYEEVRTMFEGFVHASVLAIESRDPTTKGHSVRVADLTVALARATDRKDSGCYSDVRIDRDQIKQIEYAALLHDFGKVGVRERVLVKPKKLYSEERRLIEARFQFIKRTIETETLRSKVEYLMHAERDRVAAELAAIDRDAAAKLADLDEYIQFILTCNEPTVLEQGGFERIAEIAARTFLDIDGIAHPYLTEMETDALQIPRGSLTVDEREEIQRHVVHTFEFLKQIPWGRTFHQVPGIAGAHHEMLDGSGYPEGLAEEQIPLPARMMSIADIYDALTASDRPYKKAVPQDRALDILRSEVEGGRLDRDLYQVFLDAKIWQALTPG